MLDSFPTFQIPIPMLKFFLKVFKIHCWHKKSIFRPCARESVRGSGIKMSIKLQRYERSSSVNVASQSQTAADQARFRALREMSRRHDKHVLSFRSSLLF